MLSRTPTAGAVVLPAQRRGTAVVARPWCTSSAWQRGGSPGALAPASTAGATGPRSGAMYVREPHAEIQKLVQLDKYVHFAQMTRIAPVGGGALGSHPARDPV